MNAFQGLASDEPVAITILGVVVMLMVLVVFGGFAMVVYLSPRKHRTPEDRRRARERKASHRRQAALRKRREALQRKARRQG
ncbi:hypothetical protein ACIQPT_03575 [Streptomyces sp. NPDC091289]|uniref:hypothetical protein n=1 Tax=Streptomyces sp. NPDC091289 TaxID=3365989 RepID=UPI003828BA0C